MPFDSDEILTEAEREQVADALVVHLQDVPQDYWDDHWWWVNSYMQYQLKRGRFGDIVPLLDRLMRDITFHAGNQLSPSGFGHVQVELTPPTFPGFGLEVQKALLEAVFEKEEQADNLTPRQRELLSKLGEEVEEPTAPVDVDQISAHVAKLSDPYFQLLLWWHLGEEEKARELLAGLIDKGGVQPLAVAAGFAVNVEQDVRKGFELLVKARDQSMGRMTRARIDGYLVALAAKMVWIDELKDQVDFEPARRAAMRLRRSFRDPLEVDRLAEMMGALGMDEEMERLLNPRSTRVRVGGASRFTPARRVVGAVLRKYILRDQMDAAAMEGAREIRRLLTTNRGGDEEIVDMIKEADLSDDVLALLVPGESGGLTKRKIYWEACVAFERVDLAVPVLRQLVEELPDDDDLRQQLMMYLPLEERRKLILEHAEAGLVHEALTDFGVVIGAAEEAGTAEMLDALELLAEVLETLEPDPLASNDLLQALNYGQRAWVRWLAEAGSLPSLHQSIALTKEQLASKRPETMEHVRKVQAEWKRRLEVATRVGKAMLRHPQIAQPTFRLMHGYRRGHERAYGDFLEEAKQVLTVIADWEPADVDPWRVTDSGGRARVPRG